MKILFRVVDVSGKSVGRLEVDEEKLRVDEGNKLLEGVLEGPLKKGLQRRVPGEEKGDVIVDGVETEKNFNLTNLGLLEEYLFKHGYTLEEVK